MISYFRRCRSPQPKIRVELTEADQVLEAMAALGVALSVTALLTYWHRIPSRVPVQFNFYGKPTEWGPKNALLLLCGLVVLSYLLITILNRFPHAFNYLVPITEKNARRQYAIATRSIRWLKLELVWGYGYLLAACIRTSLNPSSHLSPWFMPVLLGAVFITLAVMIVGSYRAR